MTRIFVSAGESSGDAHAAAVVHALRERLPEAAVEGVGGPLLAAAGVTILQPMDRLSATGLIDAAKTLPEHVAALRRLRRHMVREPYELALLVDYPGFHLKLAAAASAVGTPVLYYIAPQLWAWGAWRIHALRKHVDHVAVILPFEEQFFTDRGVPATFVGHPLLEREPPPSREVARQRLGLSDARPVIGLFPGSRRQEIERLWPPFRDAAATLRKRASGLQVVVAATDAGHYPDAQHCIVRRNDAASVLAASDVALCKSGTTTLEAALAGTPLVIAYRVHPLTYALARALVGVPHIGLVNLLSDQCVAPELVQRRVTASGLADAVRPFLDPDGAPARYQRDAFIKIRERLGEPGASRRVASLAERLVA